MSDISFGGKPLKRKGFTFVEAVVILLIIGILAALLMPVFSSRPGISKRGACHFNLQQLGLGFMQYMQDNKDTLPPTGSDPHFGWANAIYPYTKNWQSYQCPAGSTSGEDRTNYFYNARLSRAKIDAFEMPAFTFLMGEGDDDSNANYALLDLPLAWRTEGKSPARRHLEGSNYAFADGHVKWLNPEKVTSSTPKIPLYTFKIR